MSTIETGNTAWDFLFKLTQGYPFWIVILIIVFVFCVMNAEKLLALSSAINKFFSSISKRANKKYISKGIRSSVISATKSIGSSDDILPRDLKIKWADEDDAKAFFDDDCVVIRLRQNTDPNENYVNIIYQFVSSGLFKNRKHYFDTDVMDASVLVLAQKIIKLSKPSAIALFLEDIFNPATKTNKKVKEDFDELKRIDLNGMLFNVYINELLKAVGTIEGEIPDPCLMAESRELLHFLFSIANRNPDEQIDFNFVSNYFKIGIVLAAKDSTISKNGELSHFKYIKNLIDKGYETIYIFGIGSKVDIAKRIAQKTKKDESRFLKSVTHTYKHINVTSGRRYTAVCIELRTH